MPSIFRIIPNLIAVGLLLPAAAAPKIKSRPMEGMLGWSFLIDQMSCCSKISGHQVPSEAEKLHQTRRCWISNMITLIGHQQHLSFTYLNTGQEQIGSNGNIEWESVQLYAWILANKLYFIFICRAGKGRKASTMPCLIRASHFKLH